MIVATKIGVAMDVPSTGERHVRRNWILRSVDFQIAGGESVLLLGSNGAGKSTLMRVLLGLQGIDEGNVSMNIGTGNQITNSPTASSPNSTSSAQQPWRLAVGYVSQRTQLVGSASVLTNVVHGFAGYQGDWRCSYQWLTPSWMRVRAMRWINAVGLAEKALQSARSLSGGEAQRCAIARALVREPKVLLADEPIASLDPRTRHEILDLLLKLTTSSPTALLVSSHVIHETLDRFDRVVALREGEVLLDRPSADVKPDGLELIYGHTGGEAPP